MKSKKGVFENLCLNVFARVYELQIKNIILSFLQVLASYINPSGCAVNGEAPANESRGQNSNALPSVLQELLSQSCLIPAMSSYLRNDSGTVPKACKHVV